MTHHPNTKNANSWPWPDEELSEDFIFYWFCFSCLTKLNEILKTWPLWILFFAVLLQWQIPGVMSVFCYSQNLAFKLCLSLASVVERIDRLEKKFLPLFRLVTHPIYRKRGSEKQQIKKFERSDEFMSQRNRSKNHFDAWVKISDDSWRYCFIYFPSKSVFE